MPNARVMTRIFLDRSIDIQALRMLIRIHHLNLLVYLDLHRIHPILGIAEVLSMLLSSHDFQNIEVHGIDRFHKRERNLASYI